MPAVRRYKNAAERQAAYRRRRAARGEDARLEWVPTARPVTSSPGQRRWNAMTAGALSLLETTITEMETYYEERSERWQEGERGEAFSEMVESLSEIAAALKYI